MILPCFPNSLSLLINLFGDFIVKFNQSNPLVPPGNLYYIADSFGNAEIVKVVSDQEVLKLTTVLNTTNVSHLYPQFTDVCHLLIKINTENNHICIRGFDNDPALLLVTSLLNSIKVTH
jgi:hypothetical protein